jgi:putative membrane protein
MKLQHVAGLFALTSFAAVACAPPDSDTATMGDTTAAAPAQEAPGAGQPGLGTAGTMTEPELGNFLVTVNTLEIAEAELAQQQAGNAEVRQFAEQLVQEHTRANEQLRQALGGGTTVDQEQSQQALQLRQEATQSLERMRGLSGAEFDRAFIQHQVQMHERVLDTLDRTGTTGATQDGMRPLIQELRTTLQSHLQRAQQIQQQLATAASPGS